MGAIIDTCYDGLDLGKGRQLVALKPTMESWNINFADSAACKELKIGIGAGEARLFVGQKSDINNIRSFFNTKAFFFEVKDLICYLDKAKDEFYNPTQPYLSRDGLQYIYVSNRNQLLSTKRTVVSLRYNLKADPLRCYLVLDPMYRNDYKMLRSICIPRLTEIVFEKYTTTQETDVFIKMTPVFKY